MWLISLQLSPVEGRGRLEQLQRGWSLQLEAVERAAAAVPGELSAEHLVLQPSSRPCAAAALAHLTSPSGSVASVKLCPLHPLSPPTECGLLQTERRAREGVAGRRVVLPSDGCRRRQHTDVRPSLGVPGCACNEASSSSFNCGSV